MVEAHKTKPMNDTNSATDLDFLGRIEQAPDRHTMLNCLEERLKTFGVDGFGYGFVPMRTARGLAADLAELYFHHTYPEAWDSIADGEDPLGDDPASLLLFSGVAEVDWHAAGDVADQIGDTARRIYEAELDLGMQYGLTLRAAEDDRGRILSSLGIWYADRKNHDEFLADWRRHADEIRRTMSLFDAVARGTGAPTFIGLTARERDALSYLAAGYRSAEASWKMGISEKTFEKHVANAKTKLEARTRDHAIAKALVMRAIAP